MSNLSELIQARHRLTANRESLASRESGLVDNELRTRHAELQLQQLQNVFSNPDSAAARAFRRRQLELLPEERQQLEEAKAQFEQELETLDGKVQELEASEPSVWASTGVPVVLFPVRIETCFKAAASGCDLLVRIYPDDLHLHAAPGHLTAVEEESGRTYWRSLWPTIGDRRELPKAISAAWQTLVDRVDASRVLLAASATRPENAPEDLAASAPDGPPRFARRTAAGGEGQTHAALMPDKWTVYGFDAGALLFTATGKPVPKTLPVSALRPKADGERPPDEVPREWLVEFDTAVEVGMALSIHLDEAEPTIDQLFVLGVSGDGDSGASADRVADALNAHALRGALEFIPPRAPTNNTADALSAWRSGAAPAVSPDALRLRFDATGPQNASILARALGIDGRDACAGVAGAAEDWQTSPGAMIDALWAGLTVDWDMLRRRAMNFGQLTGHPMAPFDEATYVGLRKDAVGFVRSRGPLPAIRIRRQPYGVLPVSSLDAWRTTSGDDLEALKVRILRHLRPFWQAGLADLPRAHGRKDQDSALAGVLSQDSVSEGLVWREAVGVNAPTTNTGDPVAPSTFLPDIPWSSTLLCQSVHGDAQEYKVPIVGNPGATVAHWTIRRQIVEECLGSSAMDAQTIQGKVFMHISTHPGVNPPLTKSMLYALYGYGQVREEQELLGASPDVDTEGFFRPRAERQVKLLKALERIPAEELELLTAETLDLFSHRLDAWITSIASRRLEKLRVAQPAGCHIGGFGWVESLKPAVASPTLPAPPQGFRDVQVREGDTYVLAPSLHHATSAAVLRAGFDSHTDQKAFGVNLASGRARLARWIVDGVRLGQPMGVLLGYWFERGLHDLEKDELIDDIREQFPAPIVPDAEDAAAAAEARLAIAARNVVDGLALYRAVTGTSEHPLSQAQTDLLTTLNRTVPALVGGLADLVDALGDLVLAESVHQLVGGNPMRAGVAADTLGRGESLPSRFDVIASPRSGIGLTCSVAVVLPMARPAGDSGWNREKPRARLAPQAEAWIARLLGKPSSWRITCTVTSGGAERPIDCGLDELDVCALDVIFELDVRTPGHAGVFERRLLSHVRDREATAERVALATGDRSTPWRTLSSVVKRIMGLLAVARPLEPSQLDPLYHPSDPIPRASEFDARLAAAAGSPSAAVDALGDARRALRAASPADRSRVAADAAVAAAVELAIRSNAFLQSFAGATTTLRADYDALAAAPSADARTAAARNVVRALARLADHGLDGSYPLNTLGSAGDAEWVQEQARLALESVERLDLPRRVELTDGMTVRTWIEKAIRIVRTVAGERFPIAPAFAPPPDGELVGGLAGRGPSKGAAASDVMSWLRRLGRVRQPVSDFHDLMLMLEQREPSGSPSLKVMQAPGGTEDEAWAAEALPGTAQRTAVLHVPTPVGRDAPLCGWLIDAWTERIPGLTSFASTNVSAATELAGLTYHYNQPDACAPHAVLIAVPPDVARPWTEEMLLQVVREALDLAKIRSVEHRDLPRRTPIVPVTYVLHSAEWPQEMDPAILG
jgi:hypothetical protein